MKNDTIIPQADQQYEKAYSTHYTMKNLYEAFVLYASIMVEYPDTKEAGYSRTQVENIVNAVVSKQEITDVLMDLALSHLKQDIPMVANLASE